MKPPLVPVQHDVNYSQAAMSQGCPKSGKGASERGSADQASAAEHGHVVQALCVRFTTCTVTVVQSWNQF